MKSEKRKQILSYICLLLVLTYLFLFFLPHRDECIDSGCAICTAIETVQNSMPVLLGATWCVFLCLTDTFLGLCQRWSCADNLSPVVLRVKLLN